MQESMSIKIVGPREPRVRPAAGAPPVINCCSSADDWTRGLSPFVLGPCSLYGGHVSRTHENLWQYSKLYARHADAANRPMQSYWIWARAGWNSPRAVRYPMGRGAKPLGALWDGQLLDYVSARKLIYFPSYRDAVRYTDAYQRLASLYREMGRLVLWDFDGFDHNRLDMSLRDVIHCTDDGRKMGHAFVLKCMLLYGDDVRPEDVP